MMYPSSSVRRKFIHTEDDEDEHIHVCGSGSYRLQVIPAKVWVCDRGPVFIRKYEIE